MRQFTWLLLRRRLSDIKALVLDVDGVLTDGGLWLGPAGELTKRFDVRDGLGIRLLQSVGVEVAFLSGGRGGATEVRARQLGITHCVVGAKDKPVALKELTRALAVTPEQIAFVGDDLNDLALLGQVGLLVSTADSALPLRRKADAVLVRKGGAGAVRELAERILKAKGAWRQLARNGWRDRND